MTCKERVLAALRRQDVDYAPCLPIFWSSPEAAGYLWTGEEERLDVCLNRLGVDALVDFGITQTPHPEVHERVWQDQPPGEAVPVIHKIIQTPAGELSCTVRKTGDWPHGADIPLMSDFVVSRIVKPWIETEQDMDCLAYCRRPPDVTVAQVQEQLAPVRELADRYSVPIRAAIGEGLTCSLSLFGAERAVMASVEQPELLDRLADLEHQVAVRRISLLAQAGVDLLARNGFYETTDFWSPAQLDHLLKDRLAREVELAHSAGLPVAYTVCTGVMPMLDYLRDLGFDALFGVEPALGNQDMAQIARRVGPVSCIWSGLSAPIHIGLGDPDSVSEAVAQFYQVFGKRGTILAATPSIRPHWPWENTMAMIREWKRQR